MSGRFMMTEKLAIVKVSSSFQKAPAENIYHFHISFRNKIIHEKISGTKHFIFEPISPQTLIIGGNE